MIRSLYTAATGMNAQDLNVSVIANNLANVNTSQYEPCGLTQMYSLKYGAVPIVRSVGGLADSIKEFNLKTLRGTGFKFKKFAPENFHRTVQKAISVYRKKSQWQRLTLNDMNANFGWDRAAKKYCQLYRRVLKP